MKKLNTIRTMLLHMFMMSFVFMTAHAQDSHIAVLLNMVNSKLNYGNENSAVQHYKKDLRGLQAGLSWQAGITKQFSIVTEAYFMRKGGQLKSGNPLDRVGSTLKLNTIEVPVLARVHAGRFYFSTGPYANFIFSRKVSSGSESAEATYFENRINGIRKFETGIQAGAGYQFRVKKAKMAVDFRYTHGMTSISKMDNLYNRTINISVLGFISLKHKSN